MAEQSLAFRVENILRAFRYAKDQHERQQRLADDLRCLGRPAVRALVVLHTEGISELRGTAEHAMSLFVPDIRATVPLLVTAERIVRICSGYGDEEYHRKLVGEILPFGRAGLRLLADYLFDKEGGERAGERRVGAARALGLLGLGASSAVPALVAAMRLGCEGTSWALGKLVPVSVPPLVTLLRDRLPGIRAAAAAALTSAGSKAASAVPALATALLQEDDLTVRLRIVEALGSMRQAASSAVPALVAYRRADPGSWVSYCALLALTWITGKEAAEVSKLEGVAFGNAFSDTVIETVNSHPSEDIYPVVIAKVWEMLHGHISINPETARLYLQSFKEVAKWGSLRKAAKPLGLEEHRGVRYRIRALEKELGVELMRSVGGPGRKELTLTKEGHALMQWMEQHPTVVG